MLLFKYKSDMMWPEVRDRERISHSDHGEQRDGNLADMMLSFYGS